MRWFVLARSITQYCSGETDVAMCSQCARTDNGTASSTSSTIVGRTASKHTMGMILSATPNNKRPTESSAIGRYA